MITFVPIKQSNRRKFCAVWQCQPSKQTVVVVVVVAANELCRMHNAHTCILCSIICENTWFRMEFYAFRTCIILNALCMMPEVVYISHSPFSLIKTISLPPLPKRRKSWHKYWRRSAHDERFKIENCTKYPSNNGIGDFGSND